jgi:dephospho-CoA kinase
MSGLHVIGLTGSIGMGKTTTAAMFADEGVPVWDADAAVHKIYAKGGPAAEAIAALRPAAVSHGAVDRQALKDWIAEDPQALAQLEGIVHPLVARDRQAFLERAEQQGAGVAVLDIPLIFETGAADKFDTLVVVSAPAEVQRDRVLARGTMTEAQFQQILSRQVPDAEKRARADVVIETTTLEEARAAVRSLLDRLREQRHA